MIKLNYSYTILFASTVAGVGTAADSTPTAVLWRNGSASGVSVTVSTTAQTGLYKAVFTTDSGWSAADFLELYVTAAIAGTSGYLSKVWSSTEIGAAELNSAGPTAEQLDRIEAKTNLITSSTRITIAANSGSSITLKCGDDYYGSTAKRIEITDTDSSLYDLLRTETLQARAFGAGIRRDAVIGTFSRDTITHTAASGSIPAYTTIFVECSVASDTPAGVTTYDIQITDASGRKHTPFSGQVTLVQDFKS